MEMTLNEVNIYIETYGKRKKDENYSLDARTARICCIIANTNSKKKFKEKDFMPREQKEKMTSKQFSTMLKAITLASGGEVNG